LLSAAGGYVIVAPKHDGTPMPALTAVHSALGTNPTHRQFG